MAPGAAPGTDVMSQFGPRITVESLTEGEQINAFHRYCQDPNGNFFMVDHKCMGSLHPSMGRTDGWTTAVVAKDWNRAQYSAHNQETWPLVRWTHPLWYDRRGRRLDVTQLTHVTQRIPAEQVRAKDNSEEAGQRPYVSILSVRWGGAQPVDPVTEGIGGWGMIGSTCSDNYINAFESLVFNTLGANYEIYSCFVQNSGELKKLASPLVRHQLKGKHVGAQYYLWPIGFDDGHEYPGYVEREELFNLMMYNECGGIPTRFPHNSHLYRVFASKEWTASHCLNPKLRTPLTTKVPRSLIAASPERAALQAMESLSVMSNARTNVFGFGSVVDSLDTVSNDRGKTPDFGYKDDYSKVKPVPKGVAKLGWSWEALDVRKWTDCKTLQNALIDLGEQQGSHMEYVFVQEWVDFDVEIRNYVVLPDVSKPETCRPKGAVCTMFQEETSHGGFTNFNRFGLDECYSRIFQSDNVAYQSCMDQINELIYRWLFAIRGESAEPPVFIRFDFLVKYHGNGKCSVMSGELTELGGCFLGWEQGPAVVFGAILDSYVGRLTTSDGSASKHTFMEKAKSLGSNAIPSYTPPRQNLSDRTLSLPTLNTPLYSPQARSLGPNAIPSYTPSQNVAAIVPQAGEPPQQHQYPYQQQQQQGGGGPSQGQQHQQQGQQHGGNQYQGGGQQEGNSGGQGPQNGHYQGNGNGVAPMQTS